MVVADVINRYAVAVPLKTKAASEVAAAFWSSWVQFFGVPEAVLTD